MPTYDYQCEAGHRYERRESFGSPTTHACEQCGKLAKRQLSAPPLIFKGGGWYVTDSRNARSGHSTHADTLSDSSADSGGGSSEPAATGAPDVAPE